MKFRDRIYLAIAMLVAADSIINKNENIAMIDSPLVSAHHDIKVIINTYYGKNPGHDLANTAFRGDMSASTVFPEGQRHIHNAIRALEKAEDIYIEEGEKSMKEVILILMSARKSIKDAIVHYNCRV